MNNTYPHSQAFPAQEQGPRFSFSLCLLMRGRPGNEASKIQLSISEFVQIHLNIQYIIYHTGPPTTQTTGKDKWNSAYVSAPEINTVLQSKRNFGVFIFKI